MLQVGSFYRHYKGGVYQLIAIAQLENNQEDCCIYRSYFENKTWVRPTQEFIDKFSLIEESDKSIHDLVIRDITQVFVTYPIDFDILYSQLLAIAKNLCKSINCDPVEELQKRKQKGLETYGRYLTTKHSNSSPREDALEEVLDAICYIKQWLECLKE